MKRLVACFLVVFVLLSLAGRVRAADQSEKTLTEYEAFAARKGILLIRDFYDIGSLSGSYAGKVRIVALVLSVPGGDETYAIRLEMPPVDKYNKTQIGVLDFDELESMVQSLDYMITLSERMRNENHEYREVDFITKAGIKIGFYQADQKQGSYLYVNNYASNGHIFFPVSKLPELRALLQQALEKLKALGA